MQHLEPRQMPPQANVQRKPRAGPRSLWGIAAAVVLLTAAGGYGASWLVPPSLADAVPAAEAAKRLDEFQKLKPIPVSGLAPDRAKAAIDAMGLAPAERDALVARVTGTAPAPLQTPAMKPAAAEQRLVLVELALWDSHSPDGDVVLVTSAGFSREVLLAKEPVAIQVPLSAGGAINVTGVRDGGGGITLGIQAGNGKVLMPIMSVGQSFQLPLVGL